VGVPQARRSRQLPAARNQRHVYVRVDGPLSLQTLLAKVDDEETRALLTLEFYTGMRWRSELLQLQPEHVIRDAGETWLLATRRKNDEPLMVPVHREARWALKYIPFGYGPTYYYKRFWKARAKAKMKHVRKHDMRHSLASALISSGATLREVGDMLGHKSLQSTQRYAHLYRERLVAVVGRVRGRKVPTKGARRKAGKRVSR
jgi:integrase